jgi:hypothetical protein
MAERVSAYPLFFVVAGRFVTVCHIMIVWFGTVQNVAPNHATVTTTTGHKTGFIKKSNCQKFKRLRSLYGGEGGIRTHGSPEGSLDFESSPFGLSGTSPVNPAQRAWLSCRSLACRMGGILPHHGGCRQSLDLPFSGCRSGQLCVVPAGAGSGWRDWGRLNDQ